MDLQIELLSPNSDSDASNRGLRGPEPFVMHLRRHISRVQRHIRQGRASKTGERLFDALVKQEMLRSGRAGKPFRDLHPSH